MATHFCTHAILFIFTKVVISDRAEWSVDDFIMWLEKQKESASERETACITAALGTNA